MSLLLAIDPGVTCPGAAVFHERVLVEARYFNGAGFKGDLSNIVRLAREVHAWARKIGEVHGLVMEWPQFYRQDRTSPEALACLGVFNGALATCFYDVAPVLVFPRQWKGSKKKNPTARMVLDRLDAGEVNAVEECDAFYKALTLAGAKKCKHPTMNALDAVGVGLHHLGRLTRKRVIAR